MNISLDSNLPMINKNISRLMLKADERFALQMLLKTLITILKEDLVRVVIYGSKARGDYDLDSDTDILVIVKKISSVQRKKIYETMLDVELEYDPRISLVIYSDIEYQRNIDMGSFFVENVEKEGLELWANQGLS